MRIEGVILGFDEYMNLVLGDAEEYFVKKNIRRKVGKILLKGDNITLIYDLNHEKE
jgi:small nuclear ribonucleoprotein E